MQLSGIIKPVESRTTNTE